MEEDKIICEHGIAPNCYYYSKIPNSKLGVCLKKYKNTYLCHYSEVLLNTYVVNAEIITDEEFNKMFN